MTVAEPLFQAILALIERICSGCSRERNGCTAVSLTIANQTMAIIRDGLMRPQLHASTRRTYDDLQIEFVDKGGGTRGGLAHQFILLVATSDHDDLMVGDAL